MTAANPALLLIAHGSRDPRHAATIAAIAAALRAEFRGRRGPGALVRAAYLDHDRPSAPRALRALAAAGAREVVAVPLLLGHAYHDRVDVPAALAEAPAGLRVTRTAVLGPDPALLGALEGRLRAAGAEPGPGTGVVLACAGATDPAARAALARLAMRWGRALGADVRVAHAAARPPAAGVGEAVVALRAAGARRVDVATWFLAPGRLLDRACADARAAGADTVAEPLAEAPEVVSAVLRRYADACRVERRIPA